MNGAATETNMSDPPDKTSLLSVNKLYGKNIPTWNEYLHPESIDLVQRLLSDLIQTTESARAFKGEVDFARSEMLVAQEQVGPLRLELKRLSAENNQLHKDLIAMSDEREKRDRQVETYSRQISTQSSDLRFLSTQYSHQVEVEKKRADASIAKVEEAFTRLGIVNDQPAGKIQLNKAEKIFQRLQKIDIETGLEPLETTPLFFRPPDPAIADIVQLTQSRIEELEREARKANSRTESLEGDIFSLREQLSKREDEIDRLGAELEVARAQQFGSLDRGSGKPKSSMLMAGINSLESAKERIEQLEGQIEYLQDHIDGLEKELSRIEQDQGTVHAAILHDKTSVAIQLDEEKKRNAELAKNFEQLEKMVVDMDNFKSNPLKISKEKSAASITKHVKTIAELKEKLRSTELKLETNTKRIGMSSKEISKLKKENFELNEKLAECRSQKEAAKVSVGLLTDNDITLQSFNNKIKILEDENKSLKESIINLQSELRALETSKKPKNENDSKHLVEIGALKSKIANLEMNLETSSKLLQSLMEQKTSISAELAQTSKERDDLIQALENFSDQLNDVNSEIAKLSAERDNALYLYRQVVENSNNVSATTHDSFENEKETPKSPKSPSKSPKSSAKSPKSSSKISDDLRSAKEREKKFQKENELLKSKVESLVNEIENLQADIQIMVQRQREAGSMANEALSQLEDQLQEVKKALSESEDLNDELKEQIKSMTSKLENGEESADSALRKLENSKIKISQLEIDNDDSRLKIRELNSKVTQLTLTNEKLALINADIKSKLEERERQLGDNRDLIKQVDMERDVFQRDLDRKTERIVELEDEVSRLHEAKNLAENEKIRLREEIENLTLHLNNQDRENVTLNAQLEELSRIKAQLQSACQKYQEDVENLESDLKAVSRENQSLNSDSMKVAAERDQYKAEIRECDRQLQYLDQLIRNKDEEAQKLMQSYRKLIADHEKLESNFGNTNEDLKSVRMEVVMRDKKNSALQNELDEMAQNLNKAKLELINYEKQCNNMTRSLATSDRTLRHIESEKSRLMRDLAAARDLAHSLDRGKDGVQKQCIAQALELERYSKQIEKLETELDAASSQIQAERLKTERLEALVAMERTRKIHQDKNVTEMNVSVGVREASHLKLISEQKETIASLGAQLSISSQNVVKAENRILQLEKLLANISREFEEAQNQSKQAVSKSEKLEKDLKTIDEIISDVISEKDHPKTPLEKRIASALEQTHREIQSTSKQIDLHTNIAPIEDDRLLDVLAESLQFEEDLNKAVDKENN